MSATDHPYLQLRRRLAAVQRKLTVVTVGTGLAAATIVAVFLLAATMAADWWFELPWPARLVILLVNLGFVGLILWRKVVQPIRHPLNEDDAALLIEHEHPELRSRLISAVQLPRSAEAGHAPALVQRLVADTEFMTAQLQFTRVVPARSLVGSLLGALAVVSAAGWIYRQLEPVSTELWKRAWLSPRSVPRKTRVESLTGHLTVARGQSVVIEARAHGVVPADGKLLVAHASGRKQQFLMLPSPQERGRFFAHVENVLEAFTYSVRLNDGSSESYRVTVEPQPVLLGLQCVQVYPAYTGLPPQPRALGDLALLAGSRLQLEGTASKPLTQAVARLAGLGTELPLRVDERNPRKLTGELGIPLTNLTGFAVALVDQRGLCSRDEVIYRIDVVPDRAPTVNLTYPTRKEELVTATGTLLIAFEASDDFGVGAVAIHYKVGEDPQEHVLELDLAGQTPKGLRRRHEWKLAALEPPLQEGSVVEFWVQARDRNDATGPGIGSTERFFFKVVSEAEKRADLMNRLDECLNTLASAADNQQKLNESLGELIRQKPDGSQR